MSWSLRVRRRPAPPAPAPEPTSVIERAHAIIFDARSKRLDLMGFRVGPKAWCQLVGERFDGIHPLEVIPNAGDGPPAQLFGYPVVVTPELDADAIAPMIVDPGRGIAALDVIPRRPVQPL